MNNNIILGNSIKDVLIEKTDRIQDKLYNRLQKSFGRVVFYRYLYNELHLKLDNQILIRCYLPIRRHV